MVWWRKKNFSYLWTTRVNNWTGKVSLVQFFSGCINTWTFFFVFKKVRVNQHPIPLFLGYGEDSIVTVLVEINFVLCGAVQPLSLMMWCVGWQEGYDLKFVFVDVPCQLKLCSFFFKKKKSLPLEIIIKRCREFGYQELKCYFFKGYHYCQIICQKSRGKNKKKE